MKESTRLFGFLIILYLIVFLLSLISKFTLNSIFDDAYMFIRYADNIIKSGSITWNHSGEATYGPSSLLYLAVITPFRFLFPNNPSLTVVLSSMSCGFLFIFLSIILIVRLTICSINNKNLIFIFLAVSLMAHHAEYYLSQHFITGMDTTFILSFVTFYIILNKRFELSPSRRNAILVGLGGGMAFAARPDLLIYSFSIPIMIWIFSTNQRVKQNALLILGISFTVVAAQILLAKLFLNSPLPLSFYAKGMKRYGENIYHVYHNAPRQFLTEYVSSYFLIFLIIGIDIFSNPLQYWKKSSPLEKGLLFATAIFISYYLFFVLQVMGFLQRFYYPTLPVIIFLASQSFIRVSDKIRLFFLNLKSKLPQMKTLVSRQRLIIFTLIILSIPAISVAVSISDTIYKRGLNSVNLFAIYNRCNDFDDKGWFGLREFSFLPNNLVIATTEVGCPGAMNPGKTIVDMAGLNETSIAHNGFSTELLFKKYQPDVIYMPHPDYTRMTKKLKNSRYFRNNYEYTPAHKLRAALGLALFKKSQYFASIKQIIENKMLQNRDEKFYFDLPRYCFSYKEWPKQIKLMQNRH